MWCVCCGGLLLGLLCLAALPQRARPDRMGVVAAWSVSQSKRERIEMPNATGRGGAEFSPKQQLLQICVVSPRCICCVQLPCMGKPLLPRLLPLPSPNLARRFTTFVPICTLHAGQEAQGKTHPATRSLQEPSGSSLPSFHFSATATVRIWEFYLQESTVSGRSVVSPPHPPENAPISAVEVCLPGGPAPEPEVRISKQGVRCRQVCVGQRSCSALCCGGCCRSERARLEGPV
jgi:hypothetical protein